MSYQNNYFRQEQMQRNPKNRVFRWMFGIGLMPIPAQNNRRTVRQMQQAAYRNTSCYYYLAKQ